MCTTVRPTRDTLHSRHPPSIRPSRNLLLSVFSQVPLHPTLTLSTGTPILRRSPLPTRPLPLARPRPRTRARTPRPTFIRSIWLRNVLIRRRHVQRIRPGLLQHDLLAPIFLTRLLKTTAKTQKPPPLPPGPPAPTGNPPKPTQQNPSVATNPPQPSHLPTPPSTRTEKENRKNHSPHSPLPPSSSAPRDSSSPD